MSDPILEGLNSSAASVIGSPNLKGLSMAAASVEGSPNLKGIEAAANETAEGVRTLSGGSVIFATISDMPGLGANGMAGFIEFDPVFVAIGQSGYIDLYTSQLFPVDFSVMSTATVVAAAVDFNVLGNNYQLFPVDFGVIETRSTNHLVTFNVCHGSVSFNVTEVVTQTYGPIYFDVRENAYRWLVDFNVTKNVLRTFGVNYYVAQSIIPDSLTVSYRLGAGTGSNTLARYNLTMFQDDIVVASRSLNVLKKADAPITFTITKLRQMVGGADNQLQITLAGELVYDITTPFAAAMEVTI